MSGVDIVPSTSGFTVRGKTYKLVPGDEVIVATSYREAGTLLAGRVNIYRHAYDTTVLEPVPVDGPQALAELLTTRARPLAVAPPDLHGLDKEAAKKAKEPFKKTKEAQPAFAPASLGDKRDGNVEPVPWVLIDADDIVGGAGMNAREVEARVVDACKELGACIGWRSASDTDVTPKRKLVMWLDCMLAAKDNAAAGKAVAALLAEKLDGVTVVFGKVEDGAVGPLVGLDVAQASRGQLCFLPPKGRDVFVHDGAPLSIDFEPEEDEAAAPVADFAPLRLETPATVAELRSALEHVECDDRDDWRNGCLAIRTTGWTCARDIALDWSQRSHKFDQAEFDKMWNGKPSSTDKPVTLASVFKRAQDNGWSPEVLPLGNATDNARAFLADHKGQFVYSPIYEGFVVWSPDRGKFITPTKARDTDQLVKKAIASWRDKRKAEMKGKGDDPFAAGQLKILSGLGNPAAQNSLIAMLETETAATNEVGRSLADSEFDCDPYSLGVPGGTVVITPGANGKPSSWALRPANVDDKITRSTTVAPKHNAKALKRFTDFIELTRGSDQLEWMQCAIGMLLTGKPMRGTFISVGAPQTGKSLLANVLLKMFGTYGATVSTQTVCAESSRSKTEKPRPDMIRLHGVRFAVVPEISSDDVLDAGFLKRVTGGDKVPARPLFSNGIVEISTPAKFWLHGNSVPGIAGGQQQGALQSRFNLMQYKAATSCDKSFEVDLMRPEVLAAALAWALDGACKLIDNGEVLPKNRAVDLATGGWLSSLEEQDEWLNLFARPATEGDAHGGELGSELRKAYVQYRRRLDGDDGDGWKRFTISGKAFSQFMVGKGINQLPGRASGRRFPVVLMNAEELRDRGAQPAEISAGLMDGGMDSKAVREALKALGLSDKAVSEAMLGHPVDNDTSEFPGG
ncbi:PriCT-2 domain-containing protein [Achromobacter spanius]|uniref:PriCT-2 domain-containing protein n=1 Tax=Achromobacter spanius TaxID=217203 RepID=UPI003F68FA3D